MELRDVLEGLASVLELETEDVADDSLVETIIGEIMSLVEIKSKFESIASIVNDDDSTEED